MPVLPQLSPIFFLIALSICMVWVVISDARHYVISNLLNAVLLGLYVLAALVLPLHPLSAVAAAAAVMVIGLGLFALGLMGGGDIKLLAVLSLWTGWSAATPRFIFLTTLAGGILVVVVLLMRAALPPLWIRLCPKRNLPRLLTRKQPVPYGIAIAGAFAWLLWTGQVAGLHH